MCIYIHIYVLTSSLLTSNLSKSDQPLTTQPQSRNPQPENREDHNRGVFSSASDEMMGVNPTAQAPTPLRPET